MVSHSNPKISVIIPAFNEERYLEATLASVRNQECDVPYEVIVSDNGSTDGTVAIAKQWADKVVRCKKRGPANARNKGAKHTRGDLLVFVDADTILPSNYLGEAWKIFQQKKFVGFCGALRFTNRRFKYRLIEAICNLYFVIKDGKGIATLPGYNTCVPRDIFWKLGGFPDVFVEDARFSERLLDIGPTRYFTNFYVINSSRRLEHTGVFQTLQFYFNSRKAHVPIKEASAEPLRPNKLTPALKKLASIFFHQKNRMEN